MVTGSKTLKFLNIELIVGMDSRGAEVERSYSDGKVAGLIPVHVLKCPCARR